VIAIQSLTGNATYDTGQS